MKQSVEFEDLREGDIITYTYSISYNGRYRDVTILGEVYTTSTGTHWVGDIPIYREGFVKAYRIKELPTEPGSIINDVKTIFGRRYGKAILDKKGLWRVPFEGFLTYVTPGDIKEWQ